MKTKIWISVLFTTFIWIATSAQTCKVAEHELWLGKALKEIQTIQPGMTREDLLKIFRRPGGFFTSSRLTGTYAYKDSSYIRVDVQFAPTPGTEGSSAENPKDVIETISKSYLASAVYD